MTLIFILLALVFDHGIGRPQTFRNVNWFIRLYYLFERQYSERRFWNSPSGLVFLLAAPILVFILTMFILEHYALVFVESILTLLILVYCIAHKELKQQIDAYTSAVKNGRIEDIHRLSGELIMQNVVTDDDTAEKAVLKSVLNRFHKRTFAVIFWFFVLGATGALLYRLTDRLNDEFSDIQSEFADAIRILMSILEWPSIRVLIIISGLAGSLTDMWTAWQRHDRYSLAANQAVLDASLLGALQYDFASRSTDERLLHWLHALKALINRTLMIWLSVLAAMTLSGWLG